MYTYKENRYSSHNQIIDMIRPQSTVLDVGCGQGILSRDLRMKQCQITGIDNVCIDQSVNSYFDSYFRVDLDTSTPLPLKGEFDYVIAADVLEHLRTSRQRLVELRKHMYPGSYLIASTGNIALWVYRLLLLAGRFDYTERGILDETHVHLFTIANFKRLIESCEYEIIETSFTPIPFELAIDPQKKRPKLINAITQIYQIAAKSWPCLFAYQIIVKARLKEQSHAGC
jgi:2-polyprenyl-3-methyl-5-hydroxy-6-metoxy-1,4-benzoquinol methylase